MLWLLVLAGDVVVDPLKGPHKTIAEGLAAMKEGDILRLAKGVYRESVVVERGGITIDGQGSTLTGLDPLDKAAFEAKSPGLYRARVPAWAKAQPRAVLDGLSMPGQGMLREIEPGEHLWQNEFLYVMLPEGAAWEKAVLDLRVRRDGLVVKGASKVVIRNLISEQWEGDAFRVEGAAEGVRFENCVGRLAVGGESRGLAVRDAATVAAAGCRFSKNTMALHAVHRSRTALAACVIEGSANVGARVNGAEHAFEDCVFRGNAAADLMAVSLSPESSNGGGPCAVRATRCFFAAGKGPGLSLQLGDHGGEAVVRESVFAKSTSIQHRGGTYKGDANLFGGTFEADEVELDLAGWRTSTSSDSGSEHKADIPLNGPWSAGGRDVGPRP